MKYGKHVGWCDGSHSGGRNGPMPRWRCGDLLLQEALGAGDAVGAQFRILKW